MSSNTQLLLLKIASTKYLYFGNKKLHINKQCLKIQTQNSTPLKWPVLSNVFPPNLRKKHALLQEWKK